MPLVYRAELPTTGLCSQEHHVVPACSCSESVCQWGPHPPLTHSTLQQEGPRKLLCLCVPTIRHVMSACHPALHRVKEFPHRQRNLGRWTETTAFAFSSCSCSVSGDFLFHSNDSAHLSALHDDTISKVGSLKLR